MTSDPHTCVEAPATAADDAADHAWLDVHIVGGDEVCEALVQTNDNLDLGYPTLYEDWIVTYTAGDGQSAIHKAIAAYGRSHMGTSGTVVTVTIKRDV